MGAFMGIYEEGMIRSELIESEKIDLANVFPKQPTIDAQEWLLLKEYILSMAPHDLSVSVQSTDTLRSYAISYPQIYLSPPSTTFVNIHHGQILIGDVHSRQLITSDDQLEPLSTIPLSNEGLVHRQVIGTETWMTLMGSFSPTDKAAGSIDKITKQGQTIRMIADLQRPVHSSYANLDDDDDLEIVICEFGKWTGALSYWDKNESGHYTRTNLTNRSGAIKSKVIDLNGDGALDIIALFGQGDEGLYKYINRGNGQFDQSPIVRFPPSWGSSNFTMFDMNGDGLEDIIYCAGDNADFPPIIKPYHGIYIYIQEKEHTFTQAEFIPLPGAYAAQPIINVEGGIDIAAISFFPDFSQDQTQSFVLLKKAGQDYKREILSYPNLGRWIVMDTGDIDDDGDTDILLGSLAFEVPDRGDLIQGWTKNGLPYILLINQETH